MLMLAIRAPPASLVAGTAVPVQVRRITALFVRLTRR
jgi:hypothetical protein